MSFKAASAVVGSVTAIGGGLGIYFFNNNKNNANNPPRKQLKKSKTWAEVTASSEYIAAKKTGKILNLTTYSGDEAADNDASYFLMSITINDEDAKTYEKITEISIYVNSTLVYEVDFNSEINFSNLPFSCFKNENVSSIEELNFNQLKKCDMKDKFKYMVVYLGPFDNVKKTHNSLKKNFDTWHSNDYYANVEIQFQENDTQIRTFHGYMENIFYKGFSPQINVTS